MTDARNLLVSNQVTVLLLIYLLKKDTIIIYNHHTKLILLQNRCCVENNSFLKKCCVQNYSYPRLIVNCKALLGIESHQMFFLHMVIRFPQVSKGILLHSYFTKVSSSSGWKISLPSLKFSAFSIIFLYH